MTEEQRSFITGRRRAPAKGGSASSSASSSASQFTVSAENRRDVIKSSDADERDRLPQPLKTRLGGGQGDGTQDQELQLAVTCT